ncbi:hypothetical protein LZ023_35380 (plasmid) [Pseudomonas silvicola]|nr:hypothetical protein LZ023_35380 [Pseudomonas silvicola]
MSSLECWGTLNTPQGSERVPSEQGAYHAYYEAFAQAVRDGSKPPVTPEQAIEVPMRLMLLLLAHVKIGSWN